MWRGHTNVIAGVVHANDETRAKTRTDYFINGKVVTKKFVRVDFKETPPFHTQSTPTNQSKRFTQTNGESKALKRSLITSFSKYSRENTRAGFTTTNYSYDYYCVYVLLGIIIILTDCLKVGFVFS